MYIVFYISYIIYVIKFKDYMLIIYKLFIIISKYVNYSL